MPSPSATVLVAADWAPIRAFEPIVRNDPESIYGDLLPVLRGATLRIVNCECALTRATAGIWKSGAVFKGEPAHVAGLACVPFDVACLANNHVLDYGVAGLRETLSVLGKAGIRTTGAGLTERDALASLTVAVGAARVHLVNFSEGEDLTAARGGAGVAGWDIAAVCARVARLKRRGGIVIAIGHCGLEYVPFPPPYVVEAFRSIAAAGADCVIGHHPHVPQGMERHGGTPIFYSLGNFVFYQPTDLHYRKVGFMVSLSIDRRGIRGVDLHPYRITDAGLRQLSGPESHAFHAAMSRLSAPFRTATGPARAWGAYLEYYGAEGFAAEVRAILERMKTEPRKGAAMFRNRLTTMQHAELWKDTLTRLMAGENRRPPAAARALVGEWFSRRIGGP
jgi:poly-gamma-glutamate synthesis protein (capsule biosynthesis protein)